MVGWLALTQNREFGPLTGPRNHWAKVQSRINKNRAANTRSRPTASPGTCTHFGRRRLCFLIGATERKTQISCAAAKSRD